MKKNTAIFFAAAMTLAIAQPAFAELYDPTNSGGNFQAYLAKIFTGLGVILGLGAIAMIVYAGFRMVISQGDSEAVAKAKTSLQWTISGFALITLAFVIVNGISLFLKAKQIQEGTGGLTNPLPSSNITTVASTIFTSFLGIAGLITILLLIINGFRYITAHGNDEQSAQAKQGLLWAIVGLIIILLAYVIISAVAKLINSPI
jgi:NADH:ubiquinone oxidoreductase subunit 6 (subunit J)